MCVIILYQRTGVLCQQLMSEILTGIRVIKFYAWENSFARKILRLRSANVYHIHVCMHVQCRLCVSFHSLAYREKLCLQLFSLWLYTCIVCMHVEIV